MQPIAATAPLTSPSAIAVPGDPRVERPGAGARDQCSTGATAGSGAGSNPLGHCLPGAGASMAGSHAGGSDRAGAEQTLSPAAAGPELSGASTVQHRNQDGPRQGGKPRNDPNLAPRCGAKARPPGLGCRAPAMANGRCRMHGGGSTGPRTPEGLARLAAAHTKHGNDGAAWRAVRRYQRSLIVRSRLLAGAFRFGPYLPPDLAARMRLGASDLASPPHYSNLPVTLPGAGDTTGDKTGDPGGGGARQARTGRARAVRGAGSAGAPRAAAGARGRADRGREAGAVAGGDCVGTGRRAGGAGNGAPAKGHAEPATGRLSRWGDGGAGRCGDRCRVCRWAGGAVRRVRTRPYTTGDGAVGWGGWRGGVCPWARGADRGSRTAPHTEPATGRLSRWGDGAVGPGSCRGGVCPWAEGAGRGSRTTPHATGDGGAGRCGCRGGACPWGGGAGCGSPTTPHTEPPTGRLSRWGDGAVGRGGSRGSGCPWAGGAVYRTRTRRHTTADGDASERVDGAHPFRWPTPPPNPLAPTPPPNLGPLRGPSPQGEGE